MFWLFTVIVTFSFLLSSSEGRSPGYEKFDRESYCPAVCSRRGGLENAFWCVSPPYCCVENEESLTCCNNETLKLNGRWGDYHNCSYSWLWWQNYWRVILGIGVALGGITLLCSLILCIYQMNWERKRQGRRRFCDQSADNSGTTSSADTNATPGGADNAAFSVTSSVPLSPPPYTAEKPPAYVP